MSSLPQTTGAESESNPSLQKVQGVKKILIIFYLLSLFFQPIAYAQELTAETSSTTSATVTTDTSSTWSPALHSSLTETDTLAIASTDSAEIAQEPAPLQSNDLSQTTDVTKPTTHSASILTDTTTNQAQVESSINEGSSTGKNVIQSASDASISSGNAQAKALAVNEVNTTTIGTNTQYSVTAITAPSQPITMSLIQQPCNAHLYPLTQPALLSPEQIAINNEASISSTLNVSADTGDNEVTAVTGTITTGDAATEAQVANIANTTLIGNCWFYGVISLFSPYSNSIVLPNEEQFVAVSLGAGSSLLSPTASADNTAQVLTTVNSTTNTGDNATLGNVTVTTGDSSQTLEEITNANTTIIRNTWVLIRIVNPQYWLGNFTNAIGSLVQADNELYYWLPWTGLSSGSNSGTAQQHITVTNSATINNDITLTAQTGGNRVETLSGQLITGSATTTAEILTILNTTIIGSNWYFLTMYLFDEFTGTISFARPDMALSGPEKVSIFPGESLTFPLALANVGNSSATDVTVNHSLPEGWQVNINHAHMAHVLESQHSVRVPVTITAPATTEPGTYAVQFSVANTLHEQSMTNNSIHIPIMVSARSAVTPPVTSKMSAAMPMQQTTSSYSNNSELLALARNHAVQPQSLTTPQVLGTADTLTQVDEKTSKLSIAFPMPLAGHFCKKYWELCSIGGILVTTAPLKAWERRKYRYFQSHTISGV